MQPYRFIFSLAIISLLLTYPASAAKRPLADPFSQGDGIITLLNLHSGEEARIQYRDELSYLSGGFDEMSHLLRCRLTNQEIEFPAALLELIDQIQEHFDNETIQVISGYRSQTLNSRLRRQGRGVARKSFHIKGKAMDIRIPGIPSRTLRDYALSLESGGVGHYPGRRFVHIDVGPARSW